MIITLAAATLLGLRQVAHITISSVPDHPISPYIYGNNFPDWERLPFKPTFVRQGGNRMTAYNWTTNASNAGNDYRHQNDGYMGESNEPGWTVSNFMKPAQAHGAAVLLTVPMAGYVSADKKGDGDVANTPDYIHKRFKPSLSTKHSAFTLNPDPNAEAVYQDEFVNWVEHTKSSQTPVWYSLDNEPSLWSNTHARIVPHTPSYDDFLARSVDFAGAIKRVAPKSLVFGPASYGWAEFRHFQDAAGANGRDFLDFYLAGMKDSESKAGHRLLDVLDLHWYPEARGGGVRICEGEDKAGTPEARIQAPRSLWDPNYVETSWISDSIGHKPIVLLPDTLKRIQANYPGTKLAITEYNYGGGKVVSGMLAQADVLGIFGRYGLFAASNWGLDINSPSQIAGFLAFLDYDGKGSKFASQSLTVSGETPEINSVYAASDAAKITVVIINKTKDDQTFTLNLSGSTFSSGVAYLRDSGSMQKAKTLPVQVTNGKATVTLPAESVATLELKQ